MLRYACGASRRTGPFLNLATVLIRWFLLQTLDRGPVDEFGLEAVAHIEGLGLVATGSRSGERSARAGARRPRSGDPCVDALALDPQALGDVDDPTPDAY